MPYHEIVCARCNKTIPHEPKKCKECGAWRTEFEVHLPPKWKQAPLRRA